MVICSLCKSSEQDDVNYGEFLRKGRVAVHYYCLLLTTVMEQNGDDKAGIRGFLLPDIKDCAEKTANKKCTYCRGIGANIACCNMKCYRYFHTVCGAKNNARYIFYDTFQSFCHRHIDLPEDSNPHGPEEDCAICCSAMGVYHPLKSIRTPCCSSGWFHRECLARCALSAGYFFRCPLCNDEQAFREFLINRNVFIPDRDASWELGPQAFSELERTISCNAHECRCPSGRTTNANHWKMRFCQICGSKGIHMNCDKIYLRRKFTCLDCEVMMQEIVKNKIEKASPGSEEGQSSSVESLETPVSVQESEIETPRRVLRSRTASLFREGNNCLEMVEEKPSGVFKAEKTTSNRSGVENLLENISERRVLRSRTNSLFQERTICLETIQERSSRVCKSEKTTPRKPEVEKSREDVTERRKLNSKTQSFVQQRENCLKTTQETPAGVFEVTNLLEDISERRVLRSRTKSLFQEHTPCLATDQKKHSRECKSEKTTPLKSELDTPPENMTMRHALRSRANSIFHDWTICFDTIQEVPFVGFPAEKTSPELSVQNPNSDRSITASSSASTATLHSVCSEKSPGNFDDAPPPMKRRKTFSESQLSPVPSKLILRKRNRSLYSEKSSELDDIFETPEDVKQSKGRKSKRSSGYFLDREVFSEPKRRSGRLRNKEIAVLSQNWQDVVRPVLEVSFLNNRNRPCRTAAMHSRIKTNKMREFI